MDVFEVLRGQRDAENAFHMAKYMRNQFEFLGIQTEPRRLLTKPFFQDERQRLKAGGQLDWAFVEACWQAPEREFQNVATDYLARFKVCLLPEDLKHLEQLVVTKSWWDSVDALVKTIGYLVHQFPTLKQEMLRWSLSGNLWLRRAAIIHQLGMKTATDQSLLSQCICNNFGSQEFFINKAIGWALRDYAKADADWVILFMEQHQERFAALSWREANKHLNS